MILYNTDIKQISDISELAPLLSTSIQELEYILASKEKLVRKGKIYKQDGTYRTVFICVHDSYRHLLQRIRSFLDIFYVTKIPYSVHGFVALKSIVTNASAHTQKKIVLNIDIEQFFPSIKKEDVQRMFLKIGFQEKIALIFSELVTIQAVLATGFPTSPVISNILCIPLDKELETLADSYACTYTRYADDITFSSNTTIPTRAEFSAILDKYNFSINPYKYRLYRKGGPQYVTGLTVVDSIPRLSKRLKRMIRLELYFIKKFGLLDHVSRHFMDSLLNYKNPSKFSRVLYAGYGIEGYISFIHSVEPELAKKMTFLLPPKE